jgi:hypothetical protein
MNITKDQIEVKIATDQKWLERAILAIFKKQTSDEQTAEQSKYQNLRGFNGPDAKRMTYYACWIKSGRHLSGYHLELARKRMKKYCGQLEKIANGEI